jgi:hypothetical protein
MAHALRRLACAVTATMAASGLAHAQGAAGQDGWQFAISPYVWIAGISGTIDTPFQRVPRRDVSADFGDILSNLSGYAFMGTAEIRYGRFALLGDLLTLSVESDVDTPRDRLFSGGTGRVTTTTGTILGMVRVLDDGANLLDLGAGVRPWSLTTRLSLHQGLLPARTVKESSSWTDPVIAARYSLRFTESWGFTISGDIGGFGAGSEFTWQLLGTINYRANDWLELRAGYRHMNVQRERRGTDIDISLSGPIIAATFRF